MATIQTKLVPTLGGYDGADRVVTCAGCGRDESVLNWTWPHVATDAQGRPQALIVNSQSTAPFPYWCLRCADEQDETMGLAYLQGEVRALSYKPRVVH